MREISRFLPFDITKEDIINRLFDIADDKTSYHKKGLKRIINSFTHIDRHQAQTDQDLIGRIVANNLSAEPYKRRLCSSAFNKKCNIDHEIKEGILDNADKIAEWLLSTNKDPLDITYTAIDENGEPKIIGRGFTPSLKERKTPDITMVLCKDRHAIEGFTIRTLYPNIQTQHSIDTKKSGKPLIKKMHTYINGTDNQKIFIHSTTNGYNPYVRYNEKNDSLYYKFNDTKHKMCHTISQNRDGDYIFYSHQPPSKQLIEPPYRKNTAKNKHRLNFPDDINIQALQNDFPEMLNQLKYTLEIENTIKQPPKQKERLQKLNKLMLPINTQQTESPDIPPY